MKKYTILALGLFLLHTPMSAQRKQIGDAKTILKSGKNFEQAEKLMTDLLKDSANLGNTRIYDIWLQAVEKQYLAINEKMYLKQQVDTTRFFDLTQRMFVVAERLDSVDARPDKKGKVNPEYRKDNAVKMQTYRPNIYYGGAHHLKKGDFKKAYSFFETYLDCDRQPLFTGYDLMYKDPKMGEVAYWATYCGYRLHDPVLTLRHAPTAQRDEGKMEYTLQYMAEAWNWLEDDSMHMATLWQGFRLYPKSNYFFPRLMDVYNSRGNYTMADSVVNEALKTDSLNYLFLYAKSTVLLNLHRYEACLKVCDELIQLKPDMADAYFNAGIACLNVAQSMDPRKNKTKLRKIYEQARSYMEPYRAKARDEVDKWDPALYRIYFNLNMGKQFDEIDRLLKSK
jgi:tetratricopeptide (TPR) repeat protein